MPPGGRAVSLQARPVSSQEKSIANAFEVVPPARNVSALAERGAGIGHADDANAPDAGDVVRRPVIGRLRDARDPSGGTRDTGWDIAHVPRATAN